MFNHNEWFPFRNAKIPIVDDFGKVTFPSPAPIPPFYHSKFNSLHNIKSGK